MKIIADSALAGVTAAFARFGDVRVLPGRAIDAAAVADANVLLVRSITPVTASLIAGSRLQFVATATSGFDHLDTAALEAAGIHWAHAPGCNAVAVAEYVAGALLQLSQRTGQSLAGKGIGVMGLGQTGRRVASIASLLGMEVRWFDPLVASADPRWQRLAHADDLLHEPVISLHVPLVASGEHATQHWLNARRLSCLKPDAWLINACRGAVVDNRALLAHLNQQPAMHAVLDVWEGEPKPNGELLAKVAIGTPHIAGYSQAGKQRGLQMIYEAFCEWQGVKPIWQPPVLPQAGTLHCVSVADAIAQASDITVLDAQFRAAMQGPDIAQAFDACRQRAAARPEFSAWSMPCADAALASALKAAGFAVC
ncbi:MAG TPA: 4-phosphoerythronate dehydrogenase [Pseudomonadales bacterium]